MKDLKQLVRPNIQALAAERKAAGRPGVPSPLRLDTNENPFNAPFNRYPPSTDALKAAIHRIKRVHPDCLFISNGIHEAIDLLFRVFCIPQKDNVVAIDPTVGMYASAAAINDIEYRRVRLDADFNFTADRLLSVANGRTKLIFLCSPNNPTGNLLDRKEILRTADRFDGFVVVDEAYIQFARSESLLHELDAHPNLIILGTFSKAFASAGIRLGVAYALPAVVRYLETACPPHHIPTPSLNEGVEMMARHFDVDKWVKQILDERDKVIAAFKLLPVCEEIYPTDANFFMAKVKNHKQVREYLLSEGISVHDCSAEARCEGCLRFSVGLTGDNNRLLGALRKYNPD